MTKVIYLSFILILPYLNYGQRVGIGLTNPTRSILEVKTNTSSSLTNRLFGSWYAGLSLQQNPPSIGLNQ